MQSPQSIAMPGELSAKAVLPELCMGALISQRVTGSWPCSMSE